MRTRMSGGVGGGSRKALPYPDLAEGIAMRFYNRRNPLGKIIDRGYPGLVVANGLLADVACFDFFADLSV